jgi:hypothetical protein
VKKEKVSLLKEAFVYERQVVFRLLNGGLEERERRSDLRSKTHRLKLNKFAEGCKWNCSMSCFPWYAK